MEDGMEDVIDFTDPESFDFDKINEDIGDVIDGFIHNTIIVI